MYSSVKAIRFTILLIIVLICGACAKHDRIELTLIIENALGPAGLKLEDLHPIQQVKRFVVTVSGDDMEKPVKINLDADASGTSLEDIPEGSLRTIRVEALNADNLVVRRKEISDITIDHDQQETITVSLNTVPLFTNLRNGNRVIVTRLKMMGVGEPGGSLEINDESAGSAEILYDVSAGDTVISPSLSLGDFSLQPPPLGLGSHIFTVRDLDNGEQTQVNVRLIPPGSRPGIGIVSLGGISDSEVVSGGIPYGSFDADLAHLPDVLLRSAL